jgi:hypothetical protein
MGRSSEEHKNVIWKRYGFLMSRPEKKFMFELGIGVYPLSALMNHHCKPNVEVRPHIDSTLHWYASKDINQVRLFPQVTTFRVLPASSSIEYSSRNTLFTISFWFLGFLTL